MITTNNLFESIDSGSFLVAQQLEKPKLKNNFFINKVEVQLVLTEAHIIICDTNIKKMPTHFLKLTFETKFEVIYQNLGNELSIGFPIAIHLEKENCTQKVILTTPHVSTLEIWALELQKKINQRNFHKLFKAKKKIGKGAFATVYLAERLRDHKMVAVKAFSKEKQYASDKGKQSLENEIKLMRRLNHSNIMKLQGVYETDNSIYVILEYLQGMQLNELLKSGKKLVHQEVKSVIYNILKALSHLSKNRIIHRDLKPQNIMFRKQNAYDLALCDFGLATHADEEKYLFVRCGTPGFVAPEIINIRDMSTKSDPISDVFSAGVIFHYLLFGHSVFEGKKYNQILSQNRSCQFNFTKEVYSQINKHCYDLLTKMLEKDASKRISAEKALNHSYFFIEPTEMEDENKEIFKQIINRSSSPNYKFKNIQDTPSTISRKKDENFYSFDQNREVRAYYYY